MVTRVATVAFQGIEAVPVDVQAHIAPGFPGLLIVGLPDKAVKESGERVRAALLASGPQPAAQAHYHQPRAGRPSQGGQPLRPADRAGPDGGDRRDPLRCAAAHVALGELGLDGRLAPTAGVLPAAIAAHGRDLGIICPEASGPEAAWAGDEIDIIAPESLLALVNHLGGYQLRPGRRPAASTPRVCPISATCAARRWHAARSKLQQPVATIC